MTRSLRDATSDCGGAGRVEGICHTAGIRTTLDIDDALLEALIARLPGRTKTQAIEEAIRGYLRADVARELRALVGEVEIEHLSSELRRVDRGA